MEDKLIIRYIQKKKEKGLEFLVDKYAGLIKVIIRRYLFNLEIYEDECMDDILLSIWNNIDKFRGEENTFKNWIISISKYKAIDYKRKYLKTIQNQEEIDFKQIKDKSAVDEEYLISELKNEIEELLSNLNEKDREIFKKLYLDEIDIEKVSEEMNLEKSYIYTRVSRGRKKLKSLAKVSSFFNL